MTQIHPEAALQAITADERVDQLGVSSRDDARRADRHRGIEQVSRERAEATDGCERCVAEQDDGALRGAIEGDQRRIAAGAALMRDDGVAIRDGPDDPIHTHRVAADTGDLLLRPRQRRRDRALTRAKFAFDVAHHVGQRRAHSANAGHVDVKIPRHRGHGVGEVTLGETNLRWALGDVGVVHAERREQTFAQQRLVVLAAALGERVGQHHHREIRILPLRAGRARQLRRGQGAEQIALGQGGVRVVHVGHAPRERRQARGIGDDVADGDLAPVERRHARSRRQQLGDGIVERDFAARDEFGEQCGGHRLGDGADLERRVLIVRAPGFRVGAEVGARGRAAVDHRRRDAGTGTIGLEALLECRAEIVVAHGKGRHCGKRDGSKAEEMPSHGPS